MVLQVIQEILPLGALQCNCSIFGDETTREAIVIDPGDGDDVNAVLAVLNEHQLKLKAIIITHAHIDHIGGAAKLKAETGAPVHMNARDQMLYDRLELQASWLGMAVPEKTGIDNPAQDGDKVILGATDFHVLHTPGHTPGSISLWIPAENTLVAGDTLFKDSIGRTDLPGGDGRQIMKSIKGQLLPLPEDATVVCGHGPSTTIGREKRRNPFLQGL